MTNLRGNLASISLTDVAQLLHVNRKTGLLQVAADKARGVLYFSNGEIIHAESNSAKGESAAFEILEWVTGHFEFLSTHVQTTPTIRRTIPDLLMDSARLQDSRKRLASIFPTLTVVPWPTLPAPQLLEGLKLFAEERQILPFFDGFRDFLDVMAASGQHDVSVLQAAAILKDAGRLEVIEPDVVLTVTLLKTGLFKKGDHLELSRTLEGQWLALGPYRGGIRQVRLTAPDGHAVGRVEFVAGLSDRQIALPREFMQTWGLAEGSQVKVRPTLDRTHIPKDHQLGMMP